jgi:hypothetical protein
MWFRRCAQLCLPPGSHGVRRYRLDEPTSVADRCGSYQTSPHLEIPLEHCEALVRPGHFDHAVTNVLGAFLAGLAFFPDLAFFGATWAPRCATRAFLAAFGCSLLPGACAVAVSAINSVILISPLAVITAVTT